MANILRGVVITPQGPVGAELGFERRIEAIVPADVSGPFIVPGFIDTHVHGGDGSDTMDGQQGVRTLARFHLRHGTTTLYPTTITNPWETVIRALDGVAAVQASRDPELPSIPGAHLEGPFISPKRLGAQPPHTVSPTSKRIETLLELDVVRLVTLAPEIPHAVDAATRFAQAGVRVSVGHSAASYDSTWRLVEAVRAVGGTVGFTHLYNAMSGLTGREPGVVGAALSDHDNFAELILDNHHVHPASARAALAAKSGHLHLITDAIRACGTPVGRSELGGQPVTVSGGVARLIDGTLAGSLLTLDQALRNAIDLGLELWQVSQLLSGVPARYLGLDDRGEIAVGKRADLVILDDRLEVLEVYVAGRHAYG